MPLSDHLLRYQRAKKTQNEESELAAILKSHSDYAPMAKQVLELLREQGYENFLFHNLDHLQIGDDVVVTSDCGEIQIKGKEAKVLFVGDDNVKVMLTDTKSTFWLYQRLLLKRLNPEKLRKMPDYEAFTDFIAGLPDASVRYLRLYDADFDREVNEYEDAMLANQIMDNGGTPPRDPEEEYISNLESVLNAIKLRIEKKFRIRK